MKYLGIDFGSKRVGIATSDDSGTIAFPLNVIPNDRDLIQSVLHIIEERHVECVVVGDTKAINGTDNPVTQSAREFIERVRSASGLPVETIFEAWSSIEASRYAPGGKGHDDAAAAAILLQRYLDIHR